jgi:membrane fusion protein (multidrug efflux system)
MDDPHPIPRRDADDASRDGRADPARPGPLDTPPPPRDAAPSSADARSPRDDAQRRDGDDRAGADAGDSAADDQGPPRRPFWKRPLGIALIAVVAIVLLVGGVLYWLNARHFETTDDAFIDGYVTQVAPRVAGQVIALRFTDNEHVAAGQVLVQLDPRDFQVKLDQAKAQRANAAASLRQAQAQVVVRQASLDQAEANVRVAAADQVQARQNYERYTGIKPGAVSKQEVENATATFRSGQAKVDAARQAVEGARAQLQAAQAEAAAAGTQVQEADANVASATLQLSYCTVVAPVSGRVGHRNVDVGNYVSPGQPMFALVQDTLWVTANFKETQLAAIRPGQPVGITVDAVPGVTFHGKVDSFQPGTGSEFSVLPAENATGNYVKIVQRLPVKIDFDDDRIGHYRLSPGMSVEPEVRVR